MASAPAVAYAIQMEFDQIAKHRKGGHGSPSLFRSDREAERALEASLEIKPGMRAIRLNDGRIAIFRNASKLPGTFGFDVWHGGWEAEQDEVNEIGLRRLDGLPVFQG